jgi:LPS-assembly protein
VHNTLVLSRLPLTPAAAPALRVVVLAVLCALGSLAQAQGTGLSLRSSPMLEERISERQRSEGAIFIGGDQVTARPDMDLVIDGQATVRRPGMAIKADHILYDQTQDIVNAEGHVRLSRDGSMFEGPRLKLQVDSFQGTFEKPTFELYRSGGYGDASQVEFIDDKRQIVRDARYTTCRRTPGPEWLPEWFVKAASMTLDTEESTVQAEDVQLRFKGVPLMSSSSVSFAMTDEPKSGFLPSLIAVDSVSGLSMSAPYYLAIAPNRDATITTHLMSKRGASVDSEFRYLEQDYKGQARLIAMPNDNLRQQSRWGLTTQHNGSLDTGLDAVGRVGVGLTLNRVSDDNFWRDFPRSGLALTQRLLPSTGVVSWGRGNFSMTAQVQRWQTLQIDTATITPPYDRAPQITMRYGQWDANGLDWSVVGDTTRFETDFSRIPKVNAATLASLRNGERSYVQAQVSRPWVRPWGFFTPKLQMHATRYQLDNALSTGESAFNRALPTFSMDSGLVFERETNWFGKAILQTLEPRAFYARTPYRDQSLLPVYDSGAADFNLSTIYSENPYVGQDRLVDNNSLTLGVTTRFFDAQSGAERLKLGMAQRIRFDNQQVVFGQSAISAGLSDMLLGAGVRWSDHWTVDSTVQVNSQTNAITRSTLQSRYNPTPYRVFNVAYRLNQGVSEQVDMGWQWPINDLWGGSDRETESAWSRTRGQGLGPDRWYSVGRMNFSLTERRLVDTIIGFEYDAGCWLGRVVLQRLQSTVSTASTQLMFQLEFSGLARVGASPLQSLRNNITNYQFLRDQTEQPSRFQSYE